MRRNLFREFPAWSLALLVALLWSVPSIAQKLLLERFPIHVVMTQSAIFYFVITLVFLYRDWSPGAQKELALVRQNLPWLALGAASAIFAGFIPNYIFTRLIEEKNPAYWVTALTSVTPVFTTLLAFYLLKERPTPRHLSGMLFVVIGIFLLSIGDNGKTQTTKMKTEPLVPSTLNRPGPVLD